MEKVGNEEQSLSALLEQDREMVITQLGSGRAQDQALKVLEKETDRLMYQAGAFEEKQAAAAQGMLQVLKYSLPLICSVTDVETWERDSVTKEKSRVSVPLPAILCGIAGVVCIIAGMIGAGPFVLFRILWAAAGCVLLVLGGFLAGRGRAKPGKSKKNDSLSIRQTFLVDPNQIWHTLQAALLGADHSLETARERALAAEQDRGTQSAGRLQKTDLQFFSELLENVYAARRRFPSDGTLDEQVENIRYYLHEHGIETEDYSPQSARWFEILPSGGGAVTIRPALLEGGAVIMKGVASGH